MKLLACFRVSESKRSKYKSKKFLTFFFCVPIPDFSGIKGPYLKPAQVLPVITVLQAISTQPRLAISVLLIPCFIVFCKY